MSNSFVTPWTVACQAPLSMGFPRWEYWNRLPFPSPGESPQPRDWTWVSCIGRQTPCHWATRQASDLLGYLGTNQASDFTFTHGLFFHFSVVFLGILFLYYPLKVQDYSLIFLQRGDISISGGLFTWENKLEATQDVNFNQIKIYCSYHVFSRLSQDKGESGPLMLYAPFCSTSHIFMCGKLYEHELQGNTEDENTIRIGRGVDDWIEKRKGGNGQWLFRASDFAPELFSKSTGDPKTWIQSSFQSLVFLGMKILSSTYPITLS